MKNVTLVLLLATGCTTGGRVFAGGAIASAAVAAVTAPNLFEPEGGHAEVFAGTFAAIAVLCALTSVAFEIFAEPATPEPTAAPPPPSITMRAAPPFVAPSTARDPQATRFTEQAYFAARVGQCTAVKALATRVRSIDADYFSAVFAVEPTIATCL